MRSEELAALMRLGDTQAQVVAELKRTNDLLADLLDAVDGGALDADEADDGEQDAEPKSPMEAVQQFAQGLAQVQNLIPKKKPVLEVT